MDNLEKRLLNTEMALVALWSLIKDTMQPAYTEGVDRMMEEYFEANKKLGASIGDRVTFFNE